MAASPERFISEVAGCGLFQVLVTAISFSAFCVSSWGMLIMAFASYNPGWTYTDQQGNELHNLSATSLPLLSPNDTVLNIQHSAGGQVCGVNRSCIYIVFHKSASTAVSEWSLINEKAWIPKLMISVQMVGVAVGSSLGGYLGDKFGRKTSLYMWVGLGAVVNVIAVFSVSWQMFVAVLFFLGLSVGGTVVSHQVYSTEFLNSKWRMFIAGIPSWNIGCFTFGLCFWALKDRRQIHIATAVFSGLIFLTVFWAPESMRWLAVHGKHDRAEAVARNICKHNRRKAIQAKLMDYEVDNDKDKLSSAKPNIYLLFRRPLLMRTVFCSCLYFILSCTYHAIGFGIQTLFGDFYQNFLIFSTVAIPLTPLVALFGHRLGRRRAYIIFLLLAATFSAAVVIVFFSVSGGTGEVAITGLAIMMSIFLDLSIDVAIVYTAELFPTLVRTQGLGLVNTAGRLGSILAPLLIPESTSLLYISYLVTCGFVLIGVAMVLALPETRGKPMNDGVELESRPDNILEGANDHFSSCQLHLNDAQ